MPSTVDEVEHVRSLITVRAVPGRRRTHATACLVESMGPSAGSWSLTVISHTTYRGHKLVLEKGTRPHWGGLAIEGEGNGGTHHHRCGGSRCGGRRGSSGGLLATTASSYTAVRISGSNELQHSQNDLLLSISPSANARRQPFARRRG
jgi:hypothetical protein